MMQTRRLALRERPGDLLLAAFFTIHVPVIVFIDAQVLLPERWFPGAARDLLQWYLDAYGDDLVRDRPAFFRALVVCELFLQLPCHVALAYAFIAGKQWGRLLGIVYGVHTATTMVPILGEIVASSTLTRNSLLAIYLPYLLVPLIVIARVIRKTNPFATPVQRQSQKIQHVTTDKSS